MTRDGNVDEQGYVGERDEQEYCIWRRWTGLREDYDQGRWWRRAGMSEEDNGGWLKKMPMERWGRCPGICAKEVKKGSVYALGKKMYKPQAEIQEGKIIGKRWWYEKWVGGGGQGTVTWRKN
jgi:hypothetical protein